MEETSVPNETNRSNWWKGATVGASVLAVVLAFGNVHLLKKTDRMEEDIRGLRDAVKTELSTLEQQTSTYSKEQQAVLADLRAKLDETGAKSAKAASLATVSAKRYSDQLAKKWSETSEAQAQEQTKLATQLGEVKDAASQTSTQMTGIATDVSGVKTDVAQHKSDLDKTIGDLRSMRGDLGVQSGLIATNAKELQALRALGDRNYFEFQLAKTKAPQKIGDVAVQLKKFDMKRNKYTVELVADDKHVEKKDRTVNEPVQFYVSKVRSPYELVVNEVKNDRIVGYLSTPKVKEMR